MHIALCDDNVADRKQFERLIKKENARRNDDRDGLFLDVFGSAASLLTNPMQYDVFFLDLCQVSDVTGTDIANTLLSKGITVPIVLCCSRINYRESSFPENVMFMDKPIKAGELSEVLDHALEVLQQAVPLIELRPEGNTCYVSEPDILYAEEKSGRMEIHMKNGEVLHIRDNTANLFSQLNAFPVFFCPTRKVILNGRYLTRIGRFHVETEGAGTFRITRDILPYAQKLFDDFHGTD